QIYTLSLHDALPIFHPEGVVSTAPAKNIKAFISQRRRWGGKWRLHKAISVKLMAVFVFAFHLFYLTTLANTLLGALNPILFIGRSEEHTSELQSREK